jgi:hypothetical protein
MIGKSSLMAANRILTEEEDLQTWKIIHQRLSSSWLLSCPFGIAKLFGLRVREFSQLIKD